MFYILKWKLCLYVNLQLNRQCGFLVQDLNITWIIHRYPVISAIRMGRPRKLREILPPETRLEATHRLNPLSGLSSDTYSSNCMYASSWLEPHTLEKSTYLSLPENFGYYGYCMDKTTILLKSLEDVVNRLNVDSSSPASGPMAFHATGDFYTDRHTTFKIQNESQNVYPDYGVIGSSDPNGVHSNNKLISRSHNGVPSSEDSLFSAQNAGSIYSNTAYSQDLSLLSAMSLPRRSHVNSANAFLNLNSTSGIQSGLTTDPYACSGPLDGQGQGMTSRASGVTTDLLNFSHHIHRSGTDEMKFNYSFDNKPLTSASISGSEYSRHATFPWGNGGHSYLTSQGTSVGQH